MKIGDTIYWSTSGYKYPVIESDEITKIGRKFALTKKKLRIDLISCRNISRPFFPSVFMSEKDIFDAHEKKVIVAEIKRKIGKIEIMPIESLKKIQLILNNPYETKI